VPPHLVLASAVTLNGGGAGDPVADAMGDGPGELLADGVPAGPGAAAVVSTGPAVVGGGLGDGVVATGAGVVAGPVGAAPVAVGPVPTVVAAGSPVSSRRIPA